MEKHNHVCRICGNAEGNTVYAAREMMYGLRHKFDYFQCQKCKCLQIADLPTDMSPYYPDDYYSFRKYGGAKFKGLKGAIKKWQYRQTLLGSSIKYRLVNLVFGHHDFNLLRGLGISVQSHILDVGCGNGKSFLYPLAEVGFDNLLGCDPYLPSPINYDNGLCIKNTSVYEVQGTWDLITYHHSFEHVSDPLEQLQKASQLLSANGTCILRIPTASSFAWEHYRTNWAQLDAPRHFFLHSTESIQVLAEKAGLELLKVQYDSTHFQFSGSEKYLNDIPLSAPRPRGLHHWIKRKRKKIIYNRRAKKLNKIGRGDQAAFYLRKVS